MKKLSIICTLLMVFSVSLVQAQPYLYGVAPCSTKDFTTTADVIPFGIICLDIYLTGVTEPQYQGGGVWLDFSGSAADIAVNSAGRCMEAGTVDEGCVGPWTNGVGVNILEPAGPGTHMLLVANLGGAAPVGTDLIVGTVQLQNLGPGAGDATVTFTTIPGVPTWNPLNDEDVVPGTIVIQEVCNCTIDEDCDDGNFCNGVETCVGACGCDAGTNPCPGETCDEVNDVCFTDLDLDGVPDDQDNCPNHPNGLLLGTCVHGTIGTTCTNNEECDIAGGDGFCSMNQDDNYPPGGNGIGDACECEGDFDRNGAVDADDVTKFLEDFGRSQYNNPCP